MKKNISILLTALAIIFSSCEDWLSQDDSTALTDDQAYSSVVAISNVAANLYSRLRYEQDFGDNTSPNAEYVWAAKGYDMNDMTRWDEASQNSVYWHWAGNVGRDYRRYYDYELVRDINIHIESLKNKISSIVTEEEQRYLIAEARYIRAYVYFTLVSRMGGVPIIEEVFEYDENTITLARPRNKESEVYDYIASELDAILDDLNIISPTIKTRATKGTALALKCRTMLYAGTIAYNHEKNVAKNLILPSGATGIDKNLANKYLQQCVDAYLALKNMGTYSLYTKASNDLSESYVELFQSGNNNPEVIFCRAYDGVKFKNSFTFNNVPGRLRTYAKAGAIVNPSFNQVSAYEVLSTKTMESINPYNGPIQLESMLDGTSSFSYKVFDKKEDIFADRDPRLTATIIYPGATFRNEDVDLQAGLAIKTADGYEFRTAPTIEDVNSGSSANFYEGERITGSEGPHRVSNYISHSGFLIRKFMDVKAGTEGLGASNVPYIIFRYGEMLLNAAEAAYYLSQNGVGTYQGKDTRTLALDCINEVRERAGGASFRLTDGELDFNRIMNERRVELAYEDHRYNDLKRWRLADQVWAYDRTNDTSIVKGLWPYKIYAPGDPDHGKWLYRQVRILYRGASDNLGAPLNFDLTMYYSTYEVNDGNPYVEKNPNH